MLQRDNPINFEFVCGRVGRAKPIRVRGRWQNPAEKPASLGLVLTIFFSRFLAPAHVAAQWRLSGIQLWLLRPCASRLLTPVVLFAPRLPCRHPARFLHYLLRRGLHPVSLNFGFNPFVFPLLYLQIANSASDEPHYGTSIPVVKKKRLVDILPSRITPLKSNTNLLFAVSLQSSPCLTSSSHQMRGFLTYLQHQAQALKEQPVTPSAPISPNQARKLQSAVQLNNLPYFVRRTASNQLPVYLVTKAGGTKQLTKIQKTEGDLDALRDDLAYTLDVDVRSPDVSINRLNGHIIVKVCYFVRVGRARTANIRLIST